MLDSLDLENSSRTSSASFFSKNISAKFWRQHMPPNFGINNLFQNSCKSWWSLANSRLWTSPPFYRIDRSFQITPLGSSTSELLLGLSH
jgi:hypothetical protein